MIRYSRQAIVAAALFSLAGALGVTGIALAQDQSTTGLTMDDCQLVPDDAARLACYDRVVKAGRANVAPTPYPAPSYSAPSGGGGSVSGGGMTPEELRAQQEREFGLPEYDTKQDREQVTEIDVKIASTGVVSGGKLRFVTTDGAIWEQVEGTPASPPAPGTMVNISKNFMGGSICKVAGARTFHCMRVDRGNASQQVSPQQPSYAQAPTAPATAPAPLPETTGQMPATPPQTIAAAAPMPSQVTRDASGNIELITVQVASVSVAPDGKVRFTTSDGMTWSQTVGSTEHPPRPGDTVAISSATLGGHFCNLSKYERVRCVRLDRPERPQSQQASVPAPQLQAASTRREEATSTVAPTSVPAPAAQPVPSVQMTSATQSAASYGLPASVSMDTTPDEVTVEVAQISVAPDGKIFFTTTDGASWAQSVGATQHPPKPGDAVIISKASLGGHFCKINKHESIRCTRTDHPDA